MFVLIVIHELTEERECLDDLIKLINSAKKNNKTLNDRNGYTSGLSNDQCH